MVKTQDRPLVETQALGRSFLMGGVEIKAVDNVSLAIRKGEFLAIMGPSGSGKTTLLNLIGLIDLPDRGRVLFEGQDTSLMRERERDNLRLKKFGFVFQTFNLLPTLTALENVMFPMMVAGVPQRESWARELLAWVGLSSRLHHRPRQLSAGENQRVAIARSLANRPALILADEPTGNLDAKSKEEISGLLKRVNSEYGAAVLMVTHDPRAAGVARGIFQMSDGRLVSEGGG